MDDNDLHDDVTDDMRVRMTRAQREEIRAAGAVYAAGRPRLRGGESYVARLAMKLGLDVLRATGAQR